MSDYTHDLEYAQERLRDEVVRERRRRKFLSDCDAGLIIDPRMYRPAAEAVKTGRVSRLITEEV